MLRNFSIAGLGALVLAIGLGTVPVSAQVTATVVTKDGQRHTGQNLGFRADDGRLVIRTSFAEEPRIPVDQVAYVDFGGTPEPTVNISGSQNAVVLRDGTVHHGQVVEMSHTDRADQKTPYLVTFRTQAGQELRLPAEQVARVYFAQPGPAATTGQTPDVGQDAATVTVSSDRQWTPTGITVRRGDRLILNTTGEMQVRGETATPDGVKSGRFEPRAPMPRTLAGALIGRVGTGQPFGIGNQTSIDVPANGQLFLGVNLANMAEVTGQFQVEVRVERGATPARR